MDKRDPDEPEVGMSITFAGEAYESYQEWVKRGVESIPATIHYFCQITESDTGETFDAWLVGVDFDAEMGNTLRVVRNGDNGDTRADLSKVESVEADRLHIY